MPTRVLIADDTELYRVQLADILEGAGYEVVGTADNGRDALIMARRFRPDIAILDIVMPGMNGLEAAREITALGGPTRVVMCSSLGFEDIVNNAISAGACGFIAKPFSESTVLKALSQALGEAPGAEKG